MQSRYAVSQSKLEHTPWTKKLGSDKNARPRRLMKSGSKRFKKIKNSDGHGVEKSLFTSQKSFFWVPLNSEAPRQRPRDYHF